MEVLGEKLEGIEAMSVKIETPLTEDVIRGLRIGEEVSLSGIIYTARDMAHKRLVDMINRGEKLPFELEGAVIYYVGPAPARPGMVIGSAGPTTSYRMDPFTPTLLSLGLKGTIGKGPRSGEVIDSMVKNCALYFGATGGAAALIARSIVDAKIIAFEDLGTEALRELRVRDMPLIVINDCYGNDLYVEGRNKYREL